MEKLPYYVILIVFGAGLQTALTANETSKREPVRYKLFNNQEQLTNKYNALLLEFARSHLKEYRKNVVSLSKNCSVCDRVLGVLMNASVQSFLSVDDIVRTNSSVVHNVTSIVANAEYYGFVIILAENINEFSKHLAKLQLMYAWNPRGRHLIFTVEKPDHRELEMIFKKCWSHKILNVAVITWNQEEAYTYNPYLNNHFEMREKVYDWSILYYDKLRNMNGYSIRTRYIPFSSTDAAVWMEEEKRYKFFGSDVGYAEAFFQSVNATPAFINLTLDMIPKYQNFTFRHHIWRERKFHGAELWMNFMPFVSPFGDRCERAFPLRRDNIRVLAPKSGLKMPSIFEPYNSTTWICVLLSLITFAFFSRFLNMGQGIDENACIRTLGIFLGQTSMGNRRLGLPEKVSLQTFTMASLLILSAYQGALYGALATVSYYPEIDTLPEVLKLTNTLYTYPTFTNYLRAYAQPGINVVLFATLDNMEYMEYMKAHRNEIYAFPDSMAQVIAKLKFLSENGVPIYHTMTDFSFPSFVSHTLPYGSPYLHKLDRVFSACKEAGLNQYWEAEAQLNDILSGRIISDEAEEKPLRKLSLQTQLISFYIWGTGLLVSSLCFSAEIYHHKYGK